MNYYTETIPSTLAEKLKEKGLPITMSYHLHQPEPNVKGFVLANFKEIDCPTYAKVFDWLIEKEIYVNAYPERVSAVTQEYEYAYRPYINGQIGKESDRTFSWHKASDKAIEMALELIK